MKYLIKVVPHDHSLSWFKKVDYHSMYRQPYKYISFERVGSKLVIIFSR